MIGAPRVAIVTGGGTGLGAATAKALAARGWRVAIGYRRSGEAAEETAAACREGGGGALIHRADVTVDADCRALVAAAVAQWGRVDALVNNAGTTRFVPAEDLEGLSAQDFQDTHATNVVGAFQMTRAAAPAMRAAGGGAVVNVSSFAAIAGFGSSIAYVVSKGALNTLTIALARTLAPEIRVNAVCPSFVETRWLTDNMDPGAYAAFKARVEETAPLRRFGQPEDVAEAVLWLIEGGRLITGEVLVLDSGMRLTLGTPPVSGAGG